MTVLNKLLSISCRESAILSAKASVDGLSYFEKIKMRMHAKICPPCEHYDNDNKFIDEAIAKIVNTDSQEDLKLSEHQKEKIKKSLP